MAGIDEAIDDLLEAAAIESPTRREFEVALCRRKLEEEIDKEICEAEED